MLRLKGFGVRNLRALLDTGIIELKPITILVGKNSAGKSSFARILPLLKQSSERRKQGPLLWFGRLVDFGSFGEAISSFSTSGEIDLLLRFTAPPVLFLNRRVRTGDAESTLPPVDIDVQLKLSSEGEDGRTVLKELSLEIFGVKVKITVEGRDVRINVDGIQTAIPNETRLHLGQGSILPQIRLIYKNENLTSTVSDALFFQAQRREKLGTQSLRNAISDFVHGNTLPERKDEIADRLPLSTLSQLLGKRPANPY
jgi:AAA ATPase domain